MSGILLEILLLSEPLCFLLQLCYKVALVPINTDCPDFLLRLRANHINFKALIAVIKPGLITSPSVASK